jgi:hypothetical protein
LEEVWPLVCTFDDGRPAFASTSLLLTPADLNVKLLLRFVQGSRRWPGLHEEMWRRKHDLCWIQLLPGVLQEERSAYSLSSHLCQTRDLDGSGSNEQVMSDALFKAERVLLRTDRHMGVASIFVSETCVH